MTTKIAPVTRALLSDLWTKARTPPVTKEKAGDAQVLRVVESELRALLAVARAANPALRWTMGRDRKTSDEWDRLDRSLRRLARASNPRRRG